MTMHLSEIEIFDYIKNANRKLSENKRFHLKECEYCQRMVKEQSEVNSILLKMKYITAPDGIFNFVSARINKKPVLKRDWFFYIMLGTLAMVAMFIIFNFGTSDSNLKPNRQQQVTEFIENNISLENFRIQENVKKLYTNFIGLFKTLGRSFYGSTVIFVICVILFYIFLDQQFLRKKLHN